MASHRLCYIGPYAKKRAKELPACTRTLSPPRPPGMSTFAPPTPRICSPSCRRPWPRAKRPGTARRATARRRCVEAIQWFPYHHVASGSVEPQLVTVLVAHRALKAVGAQRRADPLEAQRLYQRDRSGVARVHLSHDDPYPVVLERVPQHARATLPCIALTPERHEH